MSWVPIENFSTAPVAIIGAGVLGRRLCVMWASRGNTVRLCDLAPDVCEAARQYFVENVAASTQVSSCSATSMSELLLKSKFPCTKPDCSSGSLELFNSVAEAVKDAWLVIECIPERLNLKIELFGELDALCDSSVILATNSSSFKSSEMISKVSNPQRVLNIHAFMPPVQYVHSSYKFVAVY